MHRHYRTSRRVLQAAVEKDRLLVNPCAKVRPPRVPARPMAILTWAQRVALAEAHPEHLKPMIYLALDSGMRWSELVGLRRGKVDVARRKVRVTEQLLRIGNEWVRPPTKTSAGVRSITIPSTAEMLQRHLAGKPDGDDEPVFTTTAGTPLQHSSFQTHAWKKALAAAGVKCRFHDLRHTSVALAIASGAHPKAIQVRMATARSPSPSTATATTSPSSTKRSPSPSTKDGPKPPPPPASPEPAGIVDEVWRCPPVSGCGGTPTPWVRFRSRLIHERLRARPHLRLRRPPTRSQ